MKNARELTEEFQREKLQELLSQCTEKQQALFQRIYPAGTVPTGVIGWMLGKYISWKVGIAIFIVVALAYASVY